MDIIVALQALPGLRVEECNEWFAKASFSPLRVELLFAANPLFALVAAQHVEIRTFRDHTLRVATVEGLLLLKLYALPRLYRQGQIARAALSESDHALLLHALADVLRDVRTRMNRKF